MRLTTTAAGPPIEVQLTFEEWAAAMRIDAASGLVATPKHLSPIWLYDDLGCELFHQITHLPEYYPSRAERSALEAHACEIADLIAATTLVELGAGTAEKTRVLLDALLARGTLRSYVPFDVVEGTLRVTAKAIATEYPRLEVWGVVGDFRRHLARIPSNGRRLIAFLGGTIGNLQPEERAGLLRELAAVMAPGDALLLGTDLVKDPDRLVAAYDDAAGVTAAFNRNVLTVMNRELGATFDLDNFDHLALYDQDNRWIEMHLRARADALVAIPALNLEVRFGAGETIRTEISAKFLPRQIATELTSAGLDRIGWWTDPAGDYALTLAVR